MCPRLVACQIRLGEYPPTIERMDRRRKASGKADPAEVKALWRRLDAIKFDTLASPPRGRPIPDRESIKRQ